jgi:adenylosuccinate synthase
VPNDAQVLAGCEPVYMEFEGWRTPTDKCKTFKQLPARAREYLKAIAELSNARLHIASATSHLSAETRASLPQHVAVIIDGSGGRAEQTGII